MKACVCVCKCVPVWYYYIIPRKPTSRYCSSPLRCWLAGWLGPPPPGRGQSHRETGHILAPHGGFVGGFGGLGTSKPFPSCRPPSVVRGPSRVWLNCHCTPPRVRAAPSDSPVFVYATFSRDRGSVGNLDARRGCTVPLTRNPKDAVVCVCIMSHVISWFFPSLRMWEASRNKSGVWCCKMGHSDRPKSRRHAGETKGGALSEGARANSGLPEKGQEVHEGGCRASLGGAFLSSSAVSSN